MTKQYKKSVQGALYNIIRRSGLQQGKKESLKEYIERVNKDIENRPDWYFIRYEIAISKGDLRIFEEDLNKILRDFVEWLNNPWGYKNTSQCTMKYGRCQNIPICSMQDYTYFTKRKAVFKELEDV